MSGFCVHWLPSSMCYRYVVLQQLQHNSKTKNPFAIYTWVRSHSNRSSWRKIMVWQFLHNLYFIAVSISQSDFLQHVEDNRMFACLLTEAVTNNGPYPSNVFWYLYSSYIATRCFVFCTSCSSKLLCPVCWWQCNQETFLSTALWTCISLAQNE